MMGRYTWGEQRHWTCQENRSRSNNLRPTRRAGIEAGSNVKRGRDGSAVVHQIVRAVCQVGTSTVLPGSNPQTGSRLRQQPCAQLQRSPSLVAGSRKQYKFWPSRMGLTHCGVMASSTGRCASEIISLVTGSSNSASRAVRAGIVPNWTTHDFEIHAFVVPLSFRS